MKFIPVTEYKTVEVFGITMTIPDSVRVVTVDKDGTVFGWEGWAKTINNGCWDINWYKHKLGRVSELDDDEWIDLICYTE